MTFVLSLRVFMIWFWGAFSDVVLWEVGDLPRLWFDHHTVTRSCMHADLLRLRGEGTGVPGAPLSLWQGEALSFVISSPVPSVRVASVVSEYVREIGRCFFVWWDYLSSPSFPQYLSVLKFLIFELRDLNPCMHTFLIRKTWESIKVVFIFRKWYFLSTHTNVLILNAFPWALRF